VIAGAFWAAEACAGTAALGCPAGRRSAVIIPLSTTTAATASHIVRQLLMLFLLAFSRAAEFNIQESVVRSQ